MPRRAIAVVWALLLLGLHGWLAIRAADGKSATFDEPLHLVGGFAYNTAADFRLHPENGALPQRWAAAALDTSVVHLPREGYAWAWNRSDIAALSTAFLYDVGNDHTQMLRAARRQAIVWSLLLGLLVFAWSWSLWGPTAAGFSVALYALSPTTLAHGPLVTSDMSAALLLPLACWAWWRHLQAPSLGSLLLSAGVAALAAIAKFSAALLPPLFLLLGMWMLWQRPQWTLSLGRERTLVGWGPRLAWLAVAVLVHVAVAWLVIWAAFDFRFSAAGPGMPEMSQYYRLWADAMPLDGPVRAVLDTLREWRALPEPYLYGFGFVLRFSESRAAFLNGEHGASGWWWFFPYAFIVKSTLAELFAFLGSALLAVLAWRRHAGAWRDRLLALPAGTVPLLAFALVFIGFSVTSNLNIGHRHLLPLYPVLFIAAGGLLAAGAAPWRRGLATLVLVVAAVEARAIHPHYLAYFNLSVGGPSQGWRHLVDSSLDWGQDAPALAEWLSRERQPGEALYYNVFGQRRMAAFGVEGVEIAPRNPERERPWVEWGPGLYAISATVLQDLYSPFSGRWDSQDESNFQVLSRQARARREADPSSARIGTRSDVGENYWTLERLQYARLVNYLRLRTPDAVLGHTIFVHRLSAAETSVLVSGDTQSYLTLLDAASR